MKNYTNKEGKLIITEDGLELVQHFESFFAHAYLDPVGIPTIGYGRINYPDGRKVKMGETCTHEEAVQWLLEDLEDEAAKYVRSMIEKDNLLKPHQFSALVSFTYNRGAGRFNEQIDDFVDAAFMNDGAIDATEMGKITKAIRSYDWASMNGTRKVLRGLTRRRLAEIEMFCGRDWKKYKA